jgi:hypothetical protein
VCILMHCNNIDAPLMRSHLPLVQCHMQIKMCIHELKMIAIVIYISNINDLKHSITAVTVNNNLNIYCHD